MTNWNNTLTKEQLWQALLLPTGLVKRCHNCVHYDTIKNGNLRRWLSGPRQDQCSKELNHIGFDCIQQKHQHWKWNGIG